MASPPSHCRQLNGIRGNALIVAALFFGGILLFLNNKTTFFEKGLIERAALAVLTLLGEVLVYCVIIAIYRVKFHPLAKHPGPFLAKITDWYSVYHCYIGDRHIDFKNLHDKYGSIVRYGPHRISVNTNTGLRDVYHVRANVQKSQFFNVFSHFFKVPMSMTTIDRKTHAFKRRVDAEALTSTAIQEMEGSVLRNVRLFCRQILVNSEDPTKAWSQAINLSEWTGYLMTDIMGDITFHRNWKMMESVSNRGILETLSKGVAGLNMMGHMPGILDLKLDKIFFSGATKGTYQYQALSQDQSEWRMEQGDKIKERDLFGSLLEARDPRTGRGFTREELISEAALLIIAGSSTSASAITATIFYLLQFPSSFSILKDEIRSSFTTVEDIHGGSILPSCHYLRACLDEAMRLSPGVGGILPREVLVGGIEIDGEHFPAGTDIGVSSYAIHHNELYYPEPYAFKPERWLLKDKFTFGVSQQGLALAQSAYCPFSVGRASCVGKSLAYNEIMTILGRLIWLYEIRLEPGSTVGEGRSTLGKDRSRKDEFQTYDRFVAAHNGPMVQFRFR